MARRRPNRSKARKNPAQTRRYLTEVLEPRTYFVVLHAGDIFEFWAEDNHMTRVVVAGNTGSTTVELIGTHVPTTQGLQQNQFPQLYTMDGQILSGPDAGIVGNGIP